VNGTVYNIVRLLHILSVLMLISGQWPLMMLMKGVVMETDPRVRLSGLKMMRRLNMGLLMPGSILAGITGFALAGIRHIPMTTPWLLSSIVLYVIALGLSMGVLKPWMKRLMVAAEAEAGGAAAGTFQAVAMASPAPLIARAATALITTALLVLMVVH